MVVEAQNTEAFVSEKSIAPGIALYVVGLKMLSAIELHDQSRGVTNKIRNVRTNWCLPAEAGVVQTMGSQSIPNQLLGIG
jgi:hypothetical protein